MTAGPRPARAKLELLVRRDDDEAFEVRAVESGFAFIHSRPQRVPDDTFELAEVASRVGPQTSFVLKNVKTERFLLLSARERFLWDLMDGATSMQEIATAYVLKYGAFDFDIIPNLIRKLQKAQLLTLNPSSRLRRVLARSRRRPVARAVEKTLTGLERITIASRRVQPLFRRLYRWGGFLLFTRVAAVACVLLAVLGLVAGVRLWHDADNIAAGLGANPVRAIVTVKLLFLFTLVAHQIVHGLALIHYGRRVREFGFTMLHGIIPTFYVDVTDIFMASRRARVVTAVSGALVHLVLGSIWFIIAARSPNGFMQAFAAASGMIQWQAFLIALYPFCFLEMDGYHVLVDVLGVPALRHDALVYTKARLRGARLPSVRREAGLWVAYVVLSAVSILAFVAFNVWMIVRAVS